MLGSDILTSSSPLRSESSSCSIDLKARSSTPPSSPVTNTPHNEENALPADATATASKQHTVNAFSILGKRKAPLRDLHGNAWPHKRTATSKDAALTQMHLSLGQAIEKRCTECGMLYVACSAEDRTLHNAYHRQLSHGYEIGPTFVAKSTAVKVAGTSSRQTSKAGEDVVCVITRDDPPWKRKHARRVLDIITRCLGACEIPEEQLWRPPSDQGTTGFELYLYIRGTTCIAAALVETPQPRAMRVLEPALRSAPDKGISALERLRRRQEEAHKQKTEPLRVSTEVCTAPIGISRIWTAPFFQKQGLAISLLDSMYDTWSSATPTRAQQRREKINDVAFSQPTEAGTKLARKWFGRQSGWLVYS